MNLPQLPSGLIAWLCDVRKLAEIKRDGTAYRDKYVDLKLDFDALDASFLNLKAERAALEQKLVDSSAEIARLLSVIENLRAADKQPHRTPDYDPYEDM